MKEVDLAMALRDPVERAEFMAKLKLRGDELMESTICQKRDLEWDSSSIFKSVPRAMLGLARSKSRKRRSKG